MTLFTLENILTTYSWLVLTNKLDNLLGTLKRFTVTIEEKLVKFVGCELNWNNENNSVLLTQRGLISTLTSKFRDAIDGMRSSNTPVASGTIIERTKEREPVLKLRINKTISLVLDHYFTY